MAQLASQLRRNALISCLFFCGLLPLVADAQSFKVPPVIQSTAGLITESELRTDLTSFAGPEMEGRGTLQPGIEKARQYLASQLGSADARFITQRVPYTLPTAAWSHFYLEIGKAKQRFEAFQDFYPDLTSSTFQVSVPQELKAAATQIELNGYAHMPKDVDAWFVNFPALDPNCRTKEPKESIARMLTFGPKLLFLVCPNADQVLAKAYVEKVRQYRFGRRDTSRKLVAYISPDTYKKMLKAAKPKRTSAAYTLINFTIAAQHAKEPSLKTEYNVLHTIPGTDTSKNLVISAHYDHLGWQEGQMHPGADDDGSGSIALLNMAKAFHKAYELGFRPAANLRFLWVSGEERGLLGSANFVQKPSFPIKSILADVNIDMIGRRMEDSAEYLEAAKRLATTDHLFVIGADFISAQLDSAVKQVNRAIARPLDLDDHYSSTTDPNRYYFRSDHYNFAKFGIPSVFFFNGTHPDYHAPSDTPDKIEYPLYCRRTQYLYQLIGAMSMRTAPYPADGKGIK